LVSVVKTVTVLEECTTEEQKTAVRSLRVKAHSAKDIHKELFPVYDGKTLPRKAVHNWPRNFLKDVRKSQMMPDQVRKWLRQQPKDFYAASFDALVKRWDKCINNGGRYVEK
jgi:hypothetical protein